MNCHFYRQKLTRPVKCYALFALILLFIGHNAVAFHIPAHKIDKQLQQIELNQPLRYQLTDKNIRVDDVDGDPELHHRWKTLTQQNPSFRLEDQALWLTTTIINVDEDPITVIIDFATPLADKLDMFVIDNNNNRMIKSVSSGTSYDFSHRELPYRTFAMEVTLQPRQTVNVYIRVLDSGSFYAHWSIWNKEAFVAHKLVATIIDGLLAGALIVLLIINLLAFNGLKEPMYAYFCGFLASYVLMISILNGSAFQLLWPGSPAINQSSVYIASGLVLLFISLFSQASQKKDDNGYVETLQYVAIFGSALVFFMPLFIPIEYHLLILLLTTLGVVIIGSGTAYWRLYLQREQALAHAAIWTIFLIGGCALSFSRLGLITNSSLTFEQASLSVICTAVILAFSLVKRVTLEKSKKEQAKTQAAQTLKQYSDIYQNAVEGLFTLSRAGELISANQQLVGTLGYESFTQLCDQVKKCGVQSVLGDPKAAQVLLDEVNTCSMVSSRDILGIKRDGSHIWGLITMRVFTPDNGEQAFIHGAVVDITEKYQANQKLVYLATHDPLTGSLNRSEFEKVLYNALTQVKEEDQVSTLLYLDLEQFEHVNQTSGHVAGDSLLRQLSDQFKAILNDQGSLARLGGDEFAILLPGISGNEAFIFAYKLIEVIKEFRFLWEENVFTIGISIGMKELNADDNSLTQIFTRVDSACAIARNKGRNRIHAHSEEDKDKDKQHLESQEHWKNTIGHALDKDLFILYQQSIAPVSEQPSLLCYEILLRMRDDQQNIIPPETFIPAAERFDLMSAIDCWVFKSYFRWLSQNHDHRQQLHMCSINISGASIADPLFKNMIEALFIEFLIPHDKICFEIDESIAIVNLHETLDFIGHFKEMGCKFSLNHFGLGFSSYGYLKNLPVDFVKIDGNFVRDLLVDPIDRAMVNSIHEVAKAMGIKTIAEFVEFDGILEELAVIGVDYAQGYAIHRPAPLAQLANE